MTIFLYSHWRALPISTRNKIATVFGIAKTGSIHVSNNHVVDDGYQIENVERALNIDALQQYTGSESSDFDELWQLMMQKLFDVYVVHTSMLVNMPTSGIIMSKGNGTSDTITLSKPTSTPLLKTAKKKSGRPKKTK